jgi:glyoxylase-like metal-dependent hydrolase (beta-lactamase superfamily II)
MPRPFYNVCMLRSFTHPPFTRISLPRSYLGYTLHGVSAYLLEDTLVDSGCPATAREFADWCDGRGIRKIVHTHHHEDHSGGDFELVRRFAVEVFAPARTVPILQQYYRLPRYRAMVWGQPRDVDAKPMGECVDIGSHRFSVIPTPGHAADHVCLYEPREGWLFSGDLYISPKVRYIRVSEDAGTILQSLRRLVELDPRLLLCSHAGFVENAREALLQRIEHWESLAENASAMAQRGATARKISRRLLGREGLMMMISGGDFSKTNLIRSLLASTGAGRALV